MNPPSNTFRSFFAAQFQPQCVDSTFSQALDPDDVHDSCIWPLPQVFYQPSQLWSDVVCSCIYRYLRVRDVEQAMRKVTVDISSIGRFRKSNDLSKWPLKGSPSVYTRLLLLQISLNLAGLSNSASLCSSSVGRCDTFLTTFTTALISLRLVATLSRNLKSGSSVSVDCITDSSLSKIAESSSFWQHLSFSGLQMIS